MINDAMSISEDQNSTCMKMIEKELEYDFGGESDEYGIEAAKIGMQSIDPSSMRSPQDMELRRKHILMDDNRLSLMVQEANLKHVNAIAETRNRGFADRAKMY